MARPRLLIPFAAAACVWLVVAVARGAVESGAWPQFRADAAHSGFNRAERRLSTANVVELHESWHVDTASTSLPLELSPVVAGGRVFLGTRTGRVEARAASSGALLWSTSIGASGGQDVAPPAVSDDTVFAVATDGTVTALDAATGSPQWTGAASTLYGVRGAPTLGANNRVFVTGSGFTAYDGWTGRVEWSRDQSSCGSCSPAVAGGVVYVTAGPASGRRIFALEAASGAVVWSYRPAAVSGPRRRAFGWSGLPAVAGRNLFVVRAAGGSPRFQVALDAFDTRSGKRRWQARVGTSKVPPASGPAIAAGLVYYACGSGRLCAFTATAGKRLWRAAVGGLLSSPTVANGIVFVGGGRSVVALAARTGRRLWRAELSGGTGTSPPVVADGAVFVVDETGRLYRFDLDA